MWLKITGMTTEFSQKRECEFLWVSTGVCACLWESMGGYEYETWAPIKYLETPEDTHKYP